MTEPARLFTIGHSNQTLERFLDLLAAAGVTAIADVRSAPMSRFAPQFNKDTLGAALKARGLSYLYLGRELGGRPKDAALMAGEKPDYAKMARAPAFQAGIEDLLRASAERPTALMCAERDPAHCHRFHLIARHLAARGVEVAHILGDGCLETQAEVETRLAGDTRQGDLFG
jgi:uncharacterized protein (DUF488 family)